MEKLLLEKLIARLKAVDIRGWTCRGNLNSASDFNSEYWWPYLSIGLSGLSFTLSKSVRGNAIRRLYDYSLMITIEDYFTIDNYVESSDKTNDAKPIGSLYNAVYNDLKRIREDEFAERINRFLTNNEQHGCKPQIEKVTAKLEELEPAQWRKNSYLDIETTFTAKVHGLIFILGIGTDYKIIKKDVKYHYLNIKNYEQDFLINYKDANLESSKEKEICGLYKKLDSLLNTHYHKEFKEKMNALLSD